MREGLTGHLIIRNGIYYDYCFREAVASIIDVCDEFIILEAHSDKDNTYEECLALRDKYRPKLRIIHGEWDGAEPKGYEFRRLARLTNQCIDACETRWNWAVQGDESYSEFGMDAVRRVVEGKTRYGDKPMAAMFRFIHLVGNPWTQFPFVYQAAIRMARTDSTWRSDNDGWRMHFSNPTDNYIIHMDFPICFHYGKLGDPLKKLIKEQDFQALFASCGFPDPKVQEMIDRGQGIDYAYLFEDAKEKGLFSPFDGTHPAVMTGWLDAHKDCWQEFTK
jgi:hypothetical protein